MGNIMTTTTNKKNSIIYNNKFKAVSFFIFRDVVPYLIINKSFKEILEYALISKQTFSYFQRLIINNCLKINYTNLYKYIRSGIYGNGRALYHLKLIQYRNIEEFQFKDSLKCYNNNETLDFKLFINKNCTNANKVEILTCIEIKSLEYKYIGDEILGEKIKKDPCHQFDPGLKGLFKFDKVALVIGKSALPISNRKEYLATHLLNPKHQDPYDYKFSFDFLNKYKARKLYLYGQERENNFQNIHGIVQNCPTIESLALINYGLSSYSNFIKLAIESPNIKSLSILLSEASGAERIYSFNYLYQGLESNLNIRKLLLFMDISTCYSNEEFKCFIDLIKPLKSLKSLCLDAFSVEDQTFPILEMKNITELHTFVNHLYIKENILNHILINSNLTKVGLHINHVNHNVFRYIDQISTNINQNNLKYLKIYCYGEEVYETFKKKFYYRSMLNGMYILKLFNNFLNYNSNNNSLKMKIKKINK